MSNEILRVKGVARYPWFNKPDTKFNEDGVYKCELEIGPEAGAAITQRFEAMQAAAQAEAQKAAKGKKVKLADLPIQPKYDDDGNETGNYILKASSYATGKNRKTGETYQRKLAIFDAKGKPTNVQVGGGSTVVLAVQPSTYNSATLGVGVKCYLEAVQVIELVSGGTRTADRFGFGVVEGGYEADDTQANDNEPEAEDEAPSAAADYDFS